MDRVQILEVLKRIKPGVASSTVVESLGYFYLDGENINSYNDKIAICHPFKTPFQAFIKADTFFNVLSKSGNPEILMKVENNQLHLKSKNMGNTGNFSVSLPLIKDEMVAERIKSIDTSIKGCKWFKLPDNFANCISLSSMFASKTALNL